jgi:hypothetical protein
MNGAYAYVFCEGGFDANGASINCGKVALTRGEYMAQVAAPGPNWKCPKCRARACFFEFASKPAQKAAS